MELRLSAERGWIVEPQPASHGTAAKARREGRPLPRRVICSLTLTEHCPYEGKEGRREGIGMTNPTDQ